MLLIGEIHRLEELHDEPVDQVLESFQNKKRNRKEKKEKWMECERLKTSMLGSVALPLSPAYPYTSILPRRTWFKHHDTINGQDKETGHNVTNPSIDHDLGDRHC